MNIDPTEEVVATLEASEQDQALREPGPWDLSDLLSGASDEELTGRLAEIEAGVAELELWRERLRPQFPAQDLLAILRRSEEVTEAIAVLASYASLWFAADTQSGAALAFRSRVQQALTGYSNRLLFLELWWKALDDANAERLLQGVAGDADAAHHLRDLRRTKPFILDERSEQIINLKDADGIAGVLTAYSIVTNRLEFRPAFGSAAGKARDDERAMTRDDERAMTRDDERAMTRDDERAMTRDELMSYVHSPVGAEREAAYREVHRVYGQEATLLGQIYAHRVRDWHNEQIGLRGYSSPIAVRNVDNDIPDAAVEALLAVARERAPLFRRYFLLKAGWLGGSGPLRRYDLYAPVAASQRQVPYAAAVELVLDTFRSFHPRFAAEAELVLANRHLDSEVRKGKKGGAFCATVLPRLSPWVLVNYTGRVRDVATLAHELGHAVHSLIASHHSIFTQHASLPLAETASVFAEMLLTERLLAEERDPLARREILATALDDVYATVLRQAYFVRFEIDAHRAVMEGKSTEELADLYLANLREQFGDSVEVPDEFRHEWISIPHIYQTPFYCYAYSFGQLLVLALYRRYQEEGERWKPGYLRLLAHGGAARPVEILAEVGVDPTDPGFWRGGFEVVEGMIREVEALAPAAAG